MQRCQLKKWASAGICACLLLASLTACGEQPAEAGASSISSSSTMSEASSAPSSEPLPESSSQPESSAAPSEPEISSASETEPAVSSSSPASEAASSEPPSDIPAPASSETPVSSEAPAPSGELMNRLTVNFQDGNGNPIEVDIFPAMLEAPNVGIGLEGMSLDDLGVAETYINNRSFNGTTLSFSLAKGCNFLFTFRPVDYAAYGLKESDRAYYSFSTDNGKATDTTFSLALNGTDIYGAPTLRVTNEVYLE